LAPVEKGKTLLVMLVPKRDHLEIMAEILSLCKQPQTKTRVMYGTNLSYKMLQRYLSELQSRGFLEVHHSLTKYVASRKGLNFLEKWRELEELL
jgi:predicted transcriptional regulator